MNEERTSSSLTEVAHVNFLVVQPWTGDLFIEKFLSGYVALLQLLDGCREVLLTRDQRNPDLYVATTLWDSLAQAQAAPDLPEDMQRLLLGRSITSTQEIVGRWVRPSWNGIERRREERRSGRERREALRAVPETPAGAEESEMHPPGEAMPATVEAAQA